jgi:hypothetical protein
MSRVISSGFDNWEKIEAEIYKKDIYLSSWSLIELITTDKLEENEREKIYKFIVEKGLCIIPFFGETEFHKLVPKNLAELTYGKYKQQLNAKIFSEKKENEAKLLRLMLMIGGHTYYFTLYLKLKDDNASNDALGALSFLCEKLFSGNLGYLLEQSSEIIDAKYLGEKDSIIGDKIFNYLNVLIHLITIYHDGVIDGKPFDIFKDFKNGLSDEQIRLVQKPIASKKLATETLNRLNGNSTVSLKKIIKEEHFNIAISETIKELEKDIPVGFLFFSLNLIKKVFFEGRKPVKNDLIDNALFELYPQYKIITFDKKMKAIIKEFDSKLFDENQMLLKI